ncbi:enoyl-CoA hydratase-related protein [Ottowia sp.]|uniref:enoyl-CoA hydratase/isomerase family protein n=1 Tax=Ottowia sp. TaxID=1898956 RepID=UPI002D12A326|nr:enoyl-CoA hydratase-related protein [Ottowia sp.]HOB67392.1 enoyl-CoA hydratase-related protein [Ottowia sp.]HPZ57100.1 enoyl-CoA hydratase-related protein [Ottowia sp.]HQD47712.1 enoyl-CoA hydratase-related protein [Ottowia sp.]
MSPPITYEAKDRIAHITLRRPERRNALNAEMSALLHDYWRRFAASDERVALLSAEGDHFCAGVDVSDPSKEAWKGVPNVGAKIDKPLISAVQGWAVGAGFTLTMMSDLCVVDETAQFMFPEAKLGLFGGITASLVSRIPHKVALEFLMLGEPLPAPRAYDVGLVNRVVPPGQAHAFALDWAQRLADAAPLVLQTIKRATLETLPKSPAEIAYPQMGYLKQIAESDDYQEGVAAFKAKRKAEFRGV